MIDAPARRSAGVGGRRGGTAPYALRRNSPTGRRIAPGEARCSYGAPICVRQPRGASRPVRPRRREENVAVRRHPVALDFGLDCNIYFDKSTAINAGLVGPRARVIPPEASGAARPAGVEPEDDPCPCRGTGRGGPGSGSPDRPPRVVRSAAARLREGSRG